MFSYLDHLECSACGRTHDHSQAMRTCPSCHKVLLAR